MKVNKVKKISLWVAVSLYLILISGFVSGRRTELLCNKVNIVITDSTTKRFIESKDVLEMLSKSNSLPLGIPVASVNTNKIEEIVLANSLLKQCTVYTSIDGQLNIILNQREPVVRIIDRQGRSYYLDDEGCIINLTKRFTPHLLVVNGSISTPFNPKSVENIYDRKYNGKAEKLREIHEMALYISRSEFWNAQIVQLYVDSKGEFELIPRIGPHLIQFGSIENYVKKFNKLWVFYNEGLKAKGWNNYLKINLKYKDQIVCTKI